MYMGSVKFFKDLILTIVFGWIIIATGLAIFFGIKYYKALDEPQSDVPAFVLEPDTMDTMSGDASLDEIYSSMLSQGYSPDEMLRYIAENEPGAYSEFIGGVAEDASSQSAFDASLPEYTKLFPELYASLSSYEFTESPNTAYLTFDDGPSENTLMILDVLKKHNIKATFFFSGGNSESAKKTMKRAADEGHTIGIHSLSHDYKVVYESVEAFLEDFNNTYTSIYEATGVKPYLYRFPGGSINNHNREIYKELIDEVTRRGFIYHDWNVSGEDSNKNATWSTIYKNVTNGVKGNSGDRAVILLHDSYGKYATVTTINDIIDTLEKDGYTFMPLDSSVKPFTFAYVD